jgi:DNA-binding NarL/FixJ family response regulator
VQQQLEIMDAGLSAASLAPNHRVGRDYLARRSWLIKHASTAATPADVVVVDDSVRDVDRLASALRLMFGRDLSVRIAKSQAVMVALLREKQPDLLIIDDNLSQSQRAESTLAAAEAHRYAGPVFIVTGMLTRLRLAELTKLGVADVIHKDDLDSTRLREAVLKINRNGS